MAQLNVPLAHHPGHRVRPGLNNQTMGWLDSWVTDNKKSTKLTWEYTFDNPGDPVIQLAHQTDPANNPVDPNAGQWTVEVRIDITTPAAELDLHGGCPHSQITSLRQTRAVAPRSIICNADEDSHVLADTEQENEIFLLVFPDPKFARDAMPQALLRWLASRILFRGAFIGLGVATNVGNVTAMMGLLQPIAGRSRVRNVL